MGPELQCHTQNFCVIIPHVYCPASHHSFEVQVVGIHYQQCMYTVLCPTIMTEVQVIGIYY